MCECDRYDISDKCLHMDVFNIPRLILVLCQSGVWRTLLVAVVECKKFFHNHNSDSVFVSVPDILVHSADGSDRL